MASRVQEQLNHLQEQISEHEHQLGGLNRFAYETLSAAVKEDKAKKARARLTKVSMLKKTIGTGKVSKAAKAMKASKATKTMKAIKATKTMKAMKAPTSSASSSWDVCPDGTRVYKRPTQR